MTGKVRRIDWSPDEWLAGVSRVLTMDEIAVYDVVLNLIYSRAGECPYDAPFIAGHFKPEGGHRQALAAQTVRVGRALDQLVKVGKLRVLRNSTGQRWLTNGRATAELNKAQGRIVSAIRAGIASGAARRANRRPTVGQPKANRSPKGSRSSDDNDLARTVVRNHQPSTIISDRSTNTEAARASRPATEGPPARAPDTKRKATKTDKRLQELARKFHEDQR